ncbi:hypothetical protein UPYG_G00123620 [Umbra pygmaea]|uniref:Transmembrane protein 218 n=1 Tax=Umbra pygmaea TaxID=75934 RepID=A0ABD0XMU4_UMBPY
MKLLEPAVWNKEFCRRNSEISTCCGKRLTVCVGEEWLLVRATGPTKLGVLPVLLLALIATLVLVFFPRSSETPSPFKDVEIVDTFFIGRYILLSVASLGFLVALFGLLPLHFLEAVYAKPLRTH